MLSADVIKERFASNEGPIDRNGMFLPADSEASVSKRLHYVLLEGTSDKTALKLLMAEGQSEFEANFTLKQTKAFIKDVLGIDVKSYVKELQTTLAHCYRVLGDKVKAANTAYAEATAAPIEYRDRSFQADARALTALQTYKSSDTYPDYWVDADNLAVEPWGKDDVEQLYVLIAARNADLHVRLTAYKVRIRVLAEKEQLAELITAEFSL